MLKWAIIFAVVSIIAGALGFSGLSAGTASIAKGFFYLFIVVTVVLLILAVAGVGVVA